LSSALIAFNDALLENYYYSAVVGLTDEIIGYYYAVVKGFLENIPYFSTLPFQA
jgi:hypothetical protein